MKSWILATTGEIIEWYEYDITYAKQEKPAYTLSKTLHLSNVVRHATKESAKGAAMKLGLKTWRYVIFS